VRELRLGLLSVPVWLGCAIGALGCGEEHAPPARVAGEFSLIAVGDTGRPPHWPPASNGQWAVARGMEAVDRRQPIDALLLLGDNFYFQGLLRSELVERIRGNVVTPYCRFLDLSGARSGEVADACPVPASERRPVPVVAVLGNHDWNTPESPLLQAEEIPRFIANWRLPGSVVEVVEIAPGVSLVLADSTALIEGADSAALVDAIRRAHGPWRVLVAHHPIGTSKDKDGWGNLVRQAITEAGVTVSLLLAGHEHNLQLLALPAPGPALVVISGGGSRPHPIQSTGESRVFAESSLGFARVTFPAQPSGRAVVAVFGTSKARALAGLDPEPLARWSLDLAGDVRDEGVPGGRAQAGATR